MHQAIKEKRTILAALMSFPHRRVTSAAIYEAPESIATAMIRQ